MTVLVGDVWVAMRPDMGLFGGDFKKGLEKILNPSGQAGLAGILNKVGAVSIATIGALTIAAVNNASKLQQSQVQLQNSANITAQTAANIANAFIDSGGKSSFSANEMLAALAPLGGQLQQIQGGYVSAADAVLVMNAATALADATTHDLSGSTATLLQVMQIYQIRAEGAATVSNLLYTTSNALGVSTDTLATSLVQVHAKLGDLAPSLADTSALMVDLQDHGVAGGRALRVVSSGLQTLIQDALKAGPATQLAVQKASLAVQKAQESLANAQTNLNQKRAIIASEGGPSTLSQEYELARLRHDVALKTQALALAEQNLSTIRANGSLSTTTATAELHQLGITILDSQGRFIGTTALIGKLHDALSGLSWGQRKLAEDLLFGKGSAQQWDKAILAGIPGVQKAQEAVNRKNAVDKASSAYLHTLPGELHAAGAALVNLSDQWGKIFLPIVTKVVGAFAEVVGWIARNKVAATILAGVVAAILGPAMLHYMWSVFMKVTEASRNLVSSLYKVASGTKETADSQVKSTDRVTTATGEYIDAKGRAHSADGKFIAMTPELQAALDKVTAATQGAAGSQDELAAATGRARDALAVEGPVGVEASAGLDATAASTDVASASADAGAVSFGVLAVSMAALGIPALIMLVTLLATHWKQTWSLIKVVAQDAWIPIHDVFNAVKLAVTDVINFFKRNWDLLLPIFLGPLGVMLLLWHRFHDQIVHGIEDVGHWFEQLPGRILHAVEGFGKLLLHAGEDLMKGLWHGIQDMAFLPLHATETIGKDIWHGVTSFFGIFSPSTRFAEAGRHMMEGLALGINDKARLPQDALKAVHLAVPGLSGATTATNSALNIQRQYLFALEQLVIATKANTAAVTALTTEERKPVRVTVHKSGGHGRSLALVLAR